MHCFRFVTCYLKLTQKKLLIIKISNDLLFQFPGNCTELRPVMFFIHGGSFLIGSAHSFRPNYLLEEDVVLVVTQYRLGPLGNHETEKM